LVLVADFYTPLIVCILNLLMSWQIRDLIVKEPKLQTTYKFIRRLAVAVRALVGVSAALHNISAAGGVIASILVAAGFVNSGWSRRSQVYPTL
jgi:hypothetical protein